MTDSSETSSQARFSKTTFFLTMELSRRKLERASQRQVCLTPGPRLSCAEYREVYLRVGGPWGWRSRRNWGDTQIASHLLRTDREIRVLRDGPDAIGFFEIEIGAHGDAEIRYFGLVPEAIGRGWAHPFLEEAIACAGARGVRRLLIKTSSTDHPKALALYQRAGFELMRTSVQERPEDLVGVRGEPRLVCLNRSLRDMTWFGTNATAQFFAEPKAIDELAELLGWARNNGHAVGILGEGANSLLPDATVQGLVLRLRGPHFERIAVDGDVVACGAGTRLSQVIAVSIRQGLGGIERLAGVPASIGGAVICNAGGRYGDIAERIEWADIVDGEGRLYRLGRSDMIFGYRNSSLAGKLVVGVGLKLQAEDRSLLRQRFLAALREKKKEQPLQQRSAGCIFKNPPGISARVLIGEAGLAGHCIGGATVSPVHCNFICVEEGTPASDILNLMALVQAEVRKRTGIALEPEIHIW